MSDRSLVAGEEAITERKQAPIAWNSNPKRLFGVVIGKRARESRETEGFLARDDVCEWRCTDREVGRGRSA